MLKDKTFEAESANSEEEKPREPYLQFQLKNKAVFQNDNMGQKLDSRRSFSEHNLSRPSRFIYDDS